MNYYKVATVFFFSCSIACESISASLKQYSYRQVTITVLDTDGKPLPDALVYAYSDRFKLSWPKLEWSEQLWNLYDEIAFERTNADGQVTAKLPPGSWTYVAAKGGDCLFL